MNRIREKILALRLFGLIVWFSIVFTFTVGAQGFASWPILSPLQSMDYGNGIAVADYNRDGLLDIYLVSMLPFAENDPKSWNRLLKGTPAGFVDVTIYSGLNRQYAGATLGGENGVKTGASWGDFDNDGYPDLFLTNQGKDQLYRNKKDGTFEDVSEQAGIRDCGACYSTSALWWDYNNDGFLDVYVNDWTISNRLYHNNGNGTFSDRSAMSGLNDKRSSFTSLPFDIDKDGDQDLYVVNDFGPNTFYLNNRDGTFTDQTSVRGLSDRGEGMGVDLCDCMHDGNFAIYLTNIWKNSPNPFFVAGENNVYKNRAQEYRLGDAGWGWGIRFFDMEHDMDEDIYLVNQLKWLDDTPDFNRLFVASGDQFKEAAKQYGVDGFEEGHGLEVFDYNRDGDLDLLVTNWGAPPVIYQNNIPDKGNWAQISLEGTQSNRDAFGAVVKIVTGPEAQHRLHHGANFLGQSIKPLHFGLANYDNIDELIIFWPSGRIEKITDVPANRFLYYKEGEQEQVFGASYGTSEAITSSSHLLSEQKINLQIYPNPVGEESWIQIKLEQPQQLILHITDVNGRILFQQAIDNKLLTYDLPWPRGVTVASGVYFFKLHTPTGVLIRKVIVRI